MYWNTVTPLLQEVLGAVMAEPLFDPFRMVGGTSLSLRIGHRFSEDIDLFTDAGYKSLDFKAIHQFFNDRYDYADTSHVETIGMGTSYFVGRSKDEAVKIDIYYSDPFIREGIEEEGIRLCSIEDIIGMKLEVISQAGRKKDFWDLHALQADFTIDTMIALYLERYPYGSTEAELRAGLINFSGADDEPDPVCLLGKHWELIKLDFVEWLESK
jgi:hypothetical protein